MLKFLGRIGKGWGTVTGVALVIAGVVAPDRIADITLLGQGVDAILMGTGGVLAAFGIGRKAGVELTKNRRAL